jgi:hypothetical protein
MLDSGSDIPAASVGHPRLVVATGGHADAETAVVAGYGQAIALEGSLMTLGNAETQSIRVPSAEFEAAEIRWNPEDDEWIFSDTTAGGSLVDGARAVGWALHHGDRIDVGDVTFIFQRDETADHRPL